MLLLRIFGQRLDLQKSCGKVFIELAPIGSTFTPSQENMEPIFGTNLSEKKLNSKVKSIPHCNVGSSKMADEAAACGARRTWVRFQLYSNVFLLSGIRWYEKYGTSSTF